MGDVPIINTFLKGYKANRQRYIFFTLAALSALACLIASSLHYSNGSNSPVAWLGWATGILFLLLAYIPWKKKKAKKKKARAIKSTDVWILLGSVGVLFFLSHLWNFQTAPWNQNGLFDDAAWDLHFVKTYILAGKPFQAAVFLDGYSASREIIYHLYLVPFFKVLGFNLLTYDIALMVLGFVTVLFTTLLIHRLFKNYVVTALSAVVMNFLPLHFIHTFVGHRYAIVAPLMMSSIYFLYAGFMDKSRFKVVVSSILGGFCFASAIMGKQYLMALFGALVLYLIFNFKKSYNKDNWNLVKLFAAGIIISSMPLLVYIFYNQTAYFANEGNYTKQFLDALKTQGMTGFMTYFTRMMDCLFGQTWYKWFLPEFPLLPVPYLIFFVPGIFIAFFRKHYSLLVLALLAPAGAFIAGFSDYRVLHSSPFWIILMAFTINEVLNLKWFMPKATAEEAPAASKVQEYYRLGSTALVTVILLTGLIPCVKYLNEKSRDPYSVWYFAQKDVAVTRYLRDIVAGVPNPSSNFRWQEFNKLEGVKEPTYDTMICQALGYAITHLFLSDYDSYKVMALSDGLPFHLMQENEILETNKKAIGNYVKGTKDLKLIWEVNEKTNKVIAQFKKLNSLGSDEVIGSQHAGQSFSFYVLNIKNANIDEFKEKVKTLQLQ